MTALLSFIYLDWATKHQQFISKLQIQREQLQKKKKILFGHKKPG